MNTRESDARGGRTRTFLSSWSTSDAAAGRMRPPSWAAMRALGPSAGFSRREARGSRLRSLAAQAAASGESDGGARARPARCLHCSVPGLAARARARRRRNTPEPPPGVGRVAGRLLALPRATSRRATVEKYDPKSLSRLSHPCAPHPGDFSRLRGRVSRPARRSETHHRCVRRLDSTQTLSSPWRATPAARH